MAWSLLGAENVKKSVQGMILRERLPHALLLTGPTGGGKFTLALDIAKAANCLSLEADGSPCGTCLSCRKIQGSTHPDVFVIVPQGKSLIIPIDRIRELRELLAYMPYEGRNKVAIIREAENFTEESGGALLKTLEEPTQNTILILTAQTPSAVMSTLVSRCLNLRIPPLSRQAILEAILTRKGLSGPKALLLAGLSRGALGRALKIDPDIALNLWEEIGNIFAAPPGSSRIQAGLAFSERLIQEFAGKKSAGDDLEVQSEKEYVDLFFLSLRLWFRDAAVAASVPDSLGFLEGPNPTPQFLKFVESFSVKQLPRYEWAINLMVKNLSRFIKPLMVIENFWLRVLE
ncbi:MAG: DNA polymerase III subunit [Deltaproteobacteria bacterium]|jgi:DNA polymerase III delta' subunit|nr:DNA polymerase III subunit [Deltaproteobacteria bacterium]